MKWILTIVLMMTDFLALILAYGLAYLLRYESGLFQVNLKGDFLSAAILLAISWIIIFAVFGHYKLTFSSSWFSLVKKIGITVLIGGLILFWLTYEAERPLPPGRFVLAAYGLTIVLLLSTTRKGVYAIQQLMWKAGKSLSKTAIIGYGKWVNTIVKELKERKELGENFIGSIWINEEEQPNLPPPILGSINDLEKLIEMYSIEKVILAWDQGNTEELLRVLLVCNQYHVGVQVVPDLRDIAAGWTRLAPREDLPLFVVTTKFRPQWERMLKRMVGGVNA